MGGWAASPGDLSADTSQLVAYSAADNPQQMGSIGSNLPAAGVVVFSGATSAVPAATIDNQGLIGALSDLAITMGTTCASVGGGDSGGLLLLAAAADGDTATCMGRTVPVQALQVQNSGTVEGYITLWPGAAHVFNNTGTFDTRHFADTDGDGVRDTKRVAISDFGGPDATFNNLGLTRLTPVTGATATDTTGEYIPSSGIASAPLDAAVYSTIRPDVVQAQFVNLATFSNAGVIDLRGAAQGNSLVITGAPAAGGAPGNGVFVANGGSLLVNTTLNGGIGAGGSISDILVVDGTRLGAAATQIVVSPTGGGALTPGNGIELVEVRNKAASADGVFALAGRIVAGPYLYHLYHGGVGADAADGNWYLRSTLDCTQSPLPAGCPSPPTPPTSSGPTEPTAPTETPPPPPEPVPSYREETSLYAALPSMTLQYGRWLLDTLHERVGEEEQIRGRTDLATRSTTNGAWARIIGVTGGQNGNARRGPQYDYNIYALQVGMDVYRKEDSDGVRNHGGFYLAAGRIDADVTHYTGTRAGRNRIDGYSIGAYWTHFRPNGWYFDGIVQGTWYDAKASSAPGLGLKTDGFGLAASLESGYPFKLDDGWVVEPQAQLIYQHVWLDSSSDAAARVKFSDVESLLGRLSLYVARSWAVGQASESEPRRLMTAWTRVGLWHEFLGDARTSFSAADGYVPFRAGHGQTWGAINIGVTGQLSRTGTLFASGGYEFGLDGHSHAINGKMGVRFNW